MTVEDEEKARDAPSETPRVPSPTPPPPDMSMFDDVTGPYPDPLAALAAIVTPAPRPVEEEELRPEDAIEPVAEPAFSRQSKPDRDSVPELDPEERLTPPSSKPAALVPDAEASRRARARITLRIPDDDIPVGSSPQPPPVEDEQDKQLINPVAVVHAMRIIAVGEPPPAPPPIEELVSVPGADERELPRARLSSEEEIVPLSEGDVESTWMPSSTAPVKVVSREPSMTDEVEVEPEPEDSELRPPLGLATPGLVVVPGPLPAPLPPPRPRMASVPPIDGVTPGPGPAGYGPLPPVEPPRPRIPSVPPADGVSPPAPQVALGPLPPIEPPRPRMASVPPNDAATPVAPPVVRSPPSEVVELEDDDVAPDSTKRGEPEPATVRSLAMESGAAQQTAVSYGPLPAITPPPPRSKPTPSPPQAAPVVVSTEDVMAAVSPSPSPVRAESPGPPPVSVEPEEVQPEVAEEPPELEAEEVVPEPAPPVPPAAPKASVQELRPAPRKPTPAPPPVDDSGPRRRVRPPWEEVFSDDFIRAFPRLTTKQIATEATFVEESLGVQKGGVILDLACGAGQHAVELASRGYNVVGYDLSLTMLALAADEAQERGQKINFLQGDMREMAFEEMFDAVYCWATSFGFFDEEKNASVLRRIHRALRQSGMFLLDLVNRDYIVPRLPTLNWFEGDGCVCIDDAQFDSITSRLRVKRTLMREDGKSREVEYSVRLYSLHEIGKMLHEAGFKVVEVSGHPATAGAYFGADSPRMIILAERR